MRSVIGQVKILVKKALAITHGDWLFLVYTKYFGYVVAIQLEIGNHTKLVKALDRH